MKSVKIMTPYPTVSNVASLLGVDQQRASELEEAAESQMKLMEQIRVNLLGGCIPIEADVSRLWAAYENRLRQFPTKLDGFFERNVGSSDRGDVNVTPQQSESSELKDRRSGLRN